MGHHPGELIYALTTTLSSLESLNNVESFQLKDIIDKRLPIPTAQVAEEILTMTKLALACINVNPQFRPTMKNAAQDLSTPRPALLDLFSSITLGRLVNLDDSQEGKNPFDST